MRQYIRLFLIVVLARMVVACYDDKGSYDYTEVNEVTVGGLEEVYKVVFKDTLRIKPELSFSQDKSTLERYEYEWRAVTYTYPYEATVIGTERDLNYYIELAPGSYAFYLKVRDKETELLWMGQSQLIVGTQVGRGFLVLGEDKKGEVSLDMISMPNDTIVLKNLLLNNGLPPLKDAKNIFFTGNADGKPGEPYMKLWITTQERSYYVNPNTFAGDLANTFEGMVYSSYQMPEQLNPVQMVTKNMVGDPSSSRIIACDNGCIFKGSLSEGEYYSDPMNRTKDKPDELFKAFPYIFYSPGFVFGAAIYDTDHHRFMSFRMGDRYASELSDNAGDIFPWKQPEGRVLWYGENTMGGGQGTSYSLMKDTDTEHFHIYKFSASFMVSKGGYYEVKPSLATDIEKAKLFAFSSERTVFMYAVGNVLYAYDYNKGYEKLEKIELEGEITMLKFDFLSSWNYSGLYVGTYNEETGGTLQKYVLGDDPNKVELTPDPQSCWTGLVKIKDIDWRGKKS